MEGSYYAVERFYGPFLPIEEMAIKGRMFSPSQIDMLMPYIDAWIADRDEPVKAEHMALWTRWLTWTTCTGGLQ